MRKSVLTFRGAYEGLQEGLYLEHLKMMINKENCYNFRVSFKLNDGMGGSPLDIVKDAKKNAINVADRYKVAIFDCDFKYNSFKDALTLAKKQNIFSAFSNINFNMFLILHKKYYYKVTTSEDMYESDLRETFNIPKTCDIKSREAMEKILEQISLSDVKKAIKRAKKVNEESEKTQKHLIDGVYDQPYFNIHIFLENVFMELEEKLLEEVK